MVSLTSAKIVKKTEKTIFEKIKIKEKKKNLRFIHYKKQAQRALS